jgi:hypothetical protein
MRCSFVWCCCCWRLVDHVPGALQAVDVVLPQGFTSAAPPHVTMSVAEGERCWAAMHLHDHTDVNVTQQPWCALTSSWLQCRAAVWVMHAGIPAKYAGELVGLRRAHAAASSTLFSIEGVQLQLEQAVGCSVTSVILLL